jgi:hypothetical protein
VRKRLSNLRWKPAVAGLLLVAAVALPVVAQSRSERFSGSGRRPAAAGEDRPTFGEGVDAEERKPRVNLSTVVEMTVLIPRAADQLAAQRWARVLGDLGVTAQMRQPILGDELHIEERVRGTLRLVEVTGQLTDDGDLQFAHRSYSPQQNRELKEWVDELLAYGAQGAPAGKPLWGLTELQFSEVYDSLSQPVAEELEGKTLDEAIAALPLPSAHPLERLSTADAHLLDAPAGVVQNRVQGLTTGTALAIILQESGLGFHPLRTPDGSLTLAIEPLQAGMQPWPVGWELSEESPQSDAAPALFKFVEIGFEDAALQDVLDAAAAAIEIPIVVDYQGTAAEGVDLAEQLVSLPVKRTSWSLMLNSVLRKAHLIKEVRRDEANRPFLYVAPFVPTRVEAQP